MRNRSCFRKLTYLSATRHTPHATMQRAHQQPRKQSTMNTETRPASQQTNQSASQPASQHPHTHAGRNASTSQDGRSGAITWHGWRGNVLVWHDRLRPQIHQLENSVVECFPGHAVICKPADRNTSTPTPNRYTPKHQHTHTHTDSGSRLAPTKTLRLVRFAVAGPLPFIVRLYNKHCPPLPSASVVERNGPSM